LINSIKRRKEPERFLNLWGRAETLSDFQLVQFLGYIRIPAKTENTERFENYLINKKEIIKR
jgi:hypothetical protein